MSSMFFIFVSILDGEGGELVERRLAHPLPEVGGRVAPASGDWQCADESLRSDERKPSAKASIVAASWAPSP